MRIAVCCPGAEEAHQICAAMEAWIARNRRSAEVVPFRSEDAFWRSFTPGRFQAAFVGWGDTQGFLCARRLRETDGACRVVVVDDTDRFAIRGFRIHLTFFLVRPLDDHQLRTAIERIFE